MRLAAQLLHFIFNRKETRLILQLEVRSDIYLRAGTSGKKSGAMAPSLVIAPCASDTLRIKEYSH